MLLNLRDVLASEGMCLPFDYAFSLAEEEFYGEHPFQGPVKVQGKLENKADVFYLTAAVSVPVSTRCARCGKPVEYVKKLDLALVITQTVSGDDIAEDVYVVEGDSFELDDIVREELLLHMELTVLCKEDCKGLCPKCGHDLNEGDCGCDRREIDPRLQKLTQLFQE